MHPLSYDFPERPMRKTAQCPMGERMLFGRSLRSLSQARSGSGSPRTPPGGCVPGEADIRLDRELSRRRMWPTLRSQADAREWAQSEQGACEAVVLRESPFFLLGSSCPEFRTRRASRGRFLEEGSGAAPGRQDSRPTRRPPESERLGPNESILVGRHPPSSCALRAVCFSRDLSHDCGCWL